MGSERAFELPELPGAPPLVLEVRQYAQTIFNTLSLELPSQPPAISLLFGSAPTSQTRPPAASSATTSEYFRRRFGVLDPAGERLQDAHREVGDLARAVGERVGAMVAERDRTFDKINRMFIAARNDGRWAPSLTAPLVDETLSELANLEKKANLLRVQMRQTAEAIATTEVPSLLDRDFPPITSQTDRFANHWSPQYEQEIRRLIAEVPSEWGATGYGNIPAGISGLLEHIYSNPGPGQSATSVGAMIGLDPDADNPGSQYAPYAIANMLPGLAQRSKVRALLLTDFEPGEQAVIDSMNEEDLGNYLRNKYNLPTDAPGAGHTDGLAHLIVAARRENVDVVAFGPYWTESTYPDDSKLPSIQGRRDASVSGRGNYLVVGHYIETHPAELDGILGPIPSIDVYNPDTHKYSGDPLDIRPGEIHYNHLDLSPIARSTAIWHPLLPGS